MSDIKMGIGPADREMPVPTLPVLGASVTPLTAAELIGRLEGFGSSSQPKFVAGHNLHSAYLIETQTVMRRFYQRSDTVVADGFPIVLAYRAALRKSSTYNRTHVDSGSRRIGSLDWVTRLRNAPNIRRIMLIGASSSSNAGAIARLKSGHPDAEYIGMPGEGWNESAEDAALGMINAFCPDLVLVGLGMPLQEQFLLENEHRLPPTTYATIGGAIDQLSGAQRPAPRWLGRYGAEWLWRLFSQPRRLGYRYLVEPTKLLSLIVRRHVSSSRHS